MKARQAKHRAVVFEDNKNTSGKLESLIAQLVDSREFEVVFHASPKKVRPLSGTQVTKLVKDLLMKPRPASLVVLDWDLSRYSQPITRELVRGLCDELSVPLAVYHAEHGPFDQVQQMLRWQENEIGIDPALPFKAIAERCVSILEGFVEIELVFSTHKGDIGASLQLLLKAPKSAEAQVDTYSWGQTRSLQIADRREKLRFAVAATGYWIHNRLLQFPGVLLNSTACASYLGVDPEEYEQREELQAPFKSALYRGPFAGLGPYWWTTGLDDILAKSTESGSQTIATGLEVLRRRGSVKPVRCIEGHEGAGFYCIITKKPVCENHSVQPSGWLPIGADRSRIHSKEYDKLSAWLKL